MHKIFIFYALWIDNVNTKRIPASKIPSSRSGRPKVYRQSDPKGVSWHYEVSHPMNRLRSTLTIFSEKRKEKHKPISSNLHAKS